MKAGKAEDQPGRVPVQRRHIVAGVIAKIHQPAARHQPQHCDEEDPVQDDVEGTPSCLPSTNKSSQPNLVQPDAAPETGPKHIDRVCQRHRDQHDRRLHMHHPHILGQNGIEKVDPGAFGHLGRDAHSADECNAEPGDKQPVQNDGSVVCLATFHGRLPLSGRRRRATPI